MKYIRIKGASQHNLKNVSIDIPRDSLVVITGVSGSGKSTLAFDTIYAEGQRRYVESLSTYARQFIGQMDKPEVESIEGLSPAIAIEQRSASHNPRSTVGTVTEIYDYLRLLFARIGSPHCFQCGREIRSQTIDTMVEQLLALPGSTAVSLLAPVVRGKKGEFQQELSRLRREGYVRVKVDGEIRDLADEIALDKNKRHDIDVVVDRLVIREGIRKRLRDSLEITARLSDGLVKADIAGGEQILFSERYACPDCNVSLPELAPRMFSFNSPYGACPECDGLGTKMFFDEDLVVPDPGLSIREGAIAPWQNRDSMYFHQMLEALSEHFGFDINTPFKELPEKIRRMLLYGSGDEAVRFYTNNGGKRTFTEKPFEGIIPNLDRRYHETDSYDMRTELERYLNMSECPACHGARLKKESLSVTVGGKNIYEFCRLSIADSMDFLKGLTLTRQEAAISERILKEIRDRLRFLLDVGMDYLSLERASGNALRRRVAAHPAGHPDRLGPLGGALRAGRAYDRASPARQRAPHRNAGAPQGHGKHGARRRARRRHDDGLRRDHRHGTGRGPRGRRGRLPGDTLGDPGKRDVAHGPLPLGPARHPRAAETQGARRDVSSSSRAPRRTTSRASTSASPWECLPA